MLKGYQPWLLLLFGAGTGGLSVAIVLTDLFGISLPVEFVPSEIDSGWGSLVGAAFTGLVAVGLFWIQRRADQRDRLADTYKRDMVNISFAIRHLEDVESFFSDKTVLKELGGFVESENHQYVTLNRDEAINILLIYEVYAGSFPKKIRRASRYLYLVSTDRPHDSKETDICHYFAIALDEIADSLDEIMRGVREDKENLIKPHVPEICELACARVRNAFLKLDRVVVFLTKLKQFA